MINKIKKLRNAVRIFFWLLKNNTFYSLIEYFYKNKNIVEANMKSQFFQKLPSSALKVVDREEYILDKANNKRILHFGFVDFPFTADKVSNKSILHLKLKNVAKYLFGVDINKAALNQYRNLTKDKNNIILDVQQENCNINLLKNNYDLVILGETLEHLKNPGIALKNLNKICLTNKNSALLITVPNSFAINGVIFALFGNECVHSDHYCYFSPYTVSKLLKDSGFKIVDLLQYSYMYPVKLPGVTNSGVIALAKPV
jgi:hypothetical protein